MLTGEFIFGEFGSENSGIAVADDIVEYSILLRIVCSHRVYLNSEVEVWDAFDVGINVVLGWHASPAGRPGRWLSPSGMPLDLWKLS